MCKSCTSLHMLILRENIRKSGKVHLVGSFDGGSRKEKAASAASIATAISTTACAVVTPQRPAPQSISTKHSILVPASVAAVPQWQAGRR